MKRSQRLCIILRFFKRKYWFPFSDAAIRPLDYSTSRILVPGVYIDGKSVLFEQDYPTVKSTEVIPFKDQYDQFLGYGVGLNLNIPIYNQRSTKTRVQKAALATKSSELQAELQKEKLNQDVYQAIANVRAAKKSLKHPNALWKQRVIQLTKRKSDLSWDLQMYLN